MYSNLTLSTCLFACYEHLCSSMLKTYINTIPNTKFILVIDSLQNRDIRFLEYLITQHINKKQHKLHYCVFEGVFKRILDKFQTTSNLILHNFVAEPREEEGKNDSFEVLAERLNDKDILIVDSIANVIFRYGIAQTYRIFNNLRNKTGLKQIIAVLHQDLMLEHFSKVNTYFGTLSTLTINVQSKFMSDLPRVQYVYKKTGGRIISEIEEYQFEAGQLITNKVAKPDPKKLLEKAIPKEVNPEELSTFRIGLTDEEKSARDQLVLPYLPDANEDTPQEGKIFYQLDEVDDWDEEDPDDDLDI